MAKKTNKNRKSAAKPNAETDAESDQLELPDRRAMEAIMREFSAFLGGARRKDTPLDRAQEIMSEAFESPPSRQVSLARQALKISPDCADAYVLLAEQAESLEEAQSLYEEGVAAGQRGLGKPAFKKYAGHFWGVLETRPYMRALGGLAQCLWQGGLLEEAAGRFRELLRLNPNDNQGARYSLATLLLDLGRHDELRDLLAQYPNDSMAHWAYAKTLLAFREEGDLPRTRQLLEEAMRANRHVPAYLLGDKRLPNESPDYISPGQDDEAASYAIGNRRLWLDTPGAITWLRTVLDVPLPEPRKPRSPAWAKLSVALRGLPQDPDETWQVDVVPDTGDGIWSILIIDKSEGQHVGMESFDSRPTPSEVWSFLADTMRRPADGEPRRPSGIEVRQAAFAKAWKLKPQQIDVQCAVLDSLDPLDRMRDGLTAMLRTAVGHDAESIVDAAELLALPQEPDDVWQAGMRQMPFWITGEGQPYRPWMALVVSRSNDLVLAQRLIPEGPSLPLLFQTIAQAIQHPAAGDPHRPRQVEFALLEEVEALNSDLERADIDGIAVPKLEFLDFLLAGMAEQMGQPGEPPALLQSPGMTAAQIASFYAAAADFYRARPWHQAPSDVPIRVVCDKFQSGPWYAVVMGQSGVQQGLAIYENLDALMQMMSGETGDEENARGMSALSLMYSEPFELSTRDLDAAEKHGWAIAGPEAYPLVLRVNPGLAIRPPLTWELELLEGCLRTVPEFLRVETPSFQKKVTTGLGELTLGLEWVEESGRR